MAVSVLAHHCSNVVGEAVWGVRATPSATATMGVLRSPSTQSSRAPEPPRRDGPGRPQRRRLPRPGRTPRRRSLAAASPLTADALGLRLLDVPVALPPLTIGIAWHPRHTVDGAHHWLRGAVRRVLVPS
nr:hypothetical protein [Catenulispora rubra]